LFDVDIAAIASTSFCGVSSYMLTLSLVVNQSTFSKLRFFVEPAVMFAIKSRFEYNQ
jgi:hypothetical protein